MKIIITAIFLLTVLSGHTQNITTIAGNGSGDGNPALNCSINAVGCTVDATGNIFIADGDHNRIRKVTPAGVMSTIAGLGFSIGNYTQPPGFTGDGGPALAAHLEHPNKVVKDLSGNTYVAQFNCVRKIDVNGIITTVAGNCNSSGYSGDGGLATAALFTGIQGFKIDSKGDFYLCLTTSHRIRKIDASTKIVTTVAGNGLGGFYGGYSGDGGPAINAQFALPEDIAIDNDGNIYISDTENNRIRKVTKSTGVVTTIASYSVSNSASPFVPRALVFDNSGNLLFGDSRSIKKIDSNGTITIIAGGNNQRYEGDGVPATTASFLGISDLFVDANNNIVIADGGYIGLRFDNYIRKISPDNIIRTVVGNGTQFYGGDGHLASVAQLYEPTGLAIDKNNNILIADSHNHAIRRISQSGIISTIAGIKPTDQNFSGSFGGDNGPATQAQLAYPMSIAVDNSNNIYIAEKNNHRIRKIDSNGIITTIAGTDAFPNSGGYGGDGGLATSARLSAPLAVALDASGSVYIADFRNSRIRKISSNGIISTVAGNGGTGFSGDGGLATAAEVSYPTGVAIDATGNIYIVTIDFRIRKVNATTGIITTIAGTGVSGFSGDGGPATSAQIRPYSCTVDNTGNLYITEGTNGLLVNVGQYNSRVRKISTNGIITTIAGVGNYGYAGDGGAATSANLNGPMGVAIDADGNVLIADRTNYRIRKITYSSSSVYTFTGNGNWDVASNWLNTNPPPLTLPSGKSIVIAPAPNGECILNVHQIIASGSYISINGTLKLLNTIDFQ